MPLGASEAVVNERDMLEKMIDGFFYNRCARAREMGSQDAGKDRDFSLLQVIETPEAEYRGYVASRFKNRVELGYFLPIKVNYWY